VGAQGAARARRPHRVERRGGGQLDRVCLVAGADPDAVEHHKHHRPARPGEPLVLLELELHGAGSLPRTALGPRTALRAAARRPDNATPMVGGTGEAGGGATAARARAVSDALEAARRGDQEALSRLFTEVYDELHELAHLQRRRWSGNH